MICQLQAYDARQAQLTMDSFLSFNERFAKIKSKRLAQAVRGISKASNPHMLMADVADEPGPKRKRGCKQAPPAQAGVLIFLPRACCKKSSLSNREIAYMDVGKSYDVTCKILFMSDKSSALFLSRSLWCPRMPQARAFILEAS